MNTLLKAILKFCTTNQLFKKMENGLLNNLNKKNTQYNVTNI